MSRIEPPQRPPLLPLSLMLAAIVLALLPWLARLYASGGLSGTPRETWSSVVASGVAIAFGVWVIVLLRRERRLNERHLEDLEAPVPVGDPDLDLWRAPCFVRAGSITRSRCSFWTWTT